MQPEQPAIGSVTLQGMLDEKEMTIDGFCLVHKRLLSYPEYTVRKCFTCEPEAAPKQAK